MISQSLKVSHNIELPNHLMLFTSIALLLLYLGPSIAAAETCFFAFKTLNSFSLIELLSLFFNLQVNLLNGKGKHKLEPWTNCPKRNDILWELLPFHNCSFSTERMDYQLDPLSVVSNDAWNIFQKRGMQFIHLNINKIA